MMAGMGVIAAQPAKPSRASKNQPKISVKWADRPDSVQRAGLLRDRRAVTAIPLGRGSPHRLDATYPHTPRTGSSCAYSVLLRVEIARFTLAGFAAQSGCAVPGLRLDWLACAIQMRACARIRTEHPGWLTTQTRLCCSDPHLTVDSR